MNWLGWLFAQAGRLVGAPLAPWPGEGVPVSVHVRRDPTGGVCWERIYAYPGRAPLSIVSTKLVTPDGALLEVTRGGIGMRLALGVEDGALTFRSTGYFWRIGAWLAPLPLLLTPGRCTVATAISAPAASASPSTSATRWPARPSSTPATSQDPPEARP